MEARIRALERGARAARPRRQRRRAEEAGFTFALVSDHFHPWIDRQGQSPFVWSVLGGIARRPSGSRRHRRHLPDDPDPSGDRRPGRRDGRGHDSGTVLPRRRHRREPQRARARPALAGGRVRREMLEEAVEVMRELWDGRADEPSGTPLHGRERADLHAARGADRRRRRGRRARGGRARGPDRRRSCRHGARGGALDAFDGRGRRGQAALRAGHRLLGAERRRAPGGRRSSGGRTRRCEGPLGQELPLPSHFEEAAAMVSEDDVAEVVVCGPTPSAIEAIVASSTRL